MTPELLFSIANTVALSGWVLLALFPRRRLVNRALCGAALPALLAALYLLLLLARAGQARGGFSTLANVHLLFEDPFTLLAGWVHYLAFDLFIGAWETRDAVRRGAPRLLLLPCLLLTFLIGPVGLLAWLGVRRFFKQGPGGERAALG